MRLLWIVPGLALAMAASGLLRWARAIARAEGYYVPGSLPQRLNNPGALKDPATGQLRAFVSPAQGWAALLTQLRLAIQGRSAHYRPDMPLRDFARIWTGGDNAEGWAAVVARELGVSMEAPVRSLVGVLA